MRAIPPAILNSTEAHYGRGETIYQPRCGLTLILQTSIRSTPPAALATWMSRRCVRLCVLCRSRHVPGCAEERAMGALQAFLAQMVSATPSDAVESASPVDDWPEGHHYWRQLQNPENHASRLMIKRYVVADI